MAIKGYEKNGVVLCENCFRAIHGDVNKLLISDKSVSIISRFIPGPLYTCSNCGTDVGYDGPQTQEGFNAEEYRNTAVGG
jgi:hypothetical protein